MHETKEDAEFETQQMLDTYKALCEQHLMIPVVDGKKTDKEKFAGAEATYTIEAMMHDGRSLQSGTSHFFGDGFSRAFDIKFTARDNTLQHPFQTSWGLSTRIIGAIIMTHGDDNGLILPPAVAPIQAAVIPVAQHKEGVLEAASALRDRLKAAGIRVKLDDSDQSPGWKFAEYEMKGVPLRVEIGPRDIESGNCVIARRDTGEKITVALAEVEQKVKEQLDALAKSLYDRALKNRKNRSCDCADYASLERAVGEQIGFYRTGWCGDAACEERLKEELDISSRCMPFDTEQVSDKCVVCGKESKATVVWGKAY
jgi:Prolyl-tRNA synthetase